MIQRLPASLIFLTLGLLFTTGQSQAAPGSGDPLTITTGVVHQVSSVNDLSNALNAVNAANLPATILLEDGTYQLNGLALVITCPGLIVRSKNGDRDAVVLRGPDEGPSAVQRNIFLVESDNVTIADLTLGYCRNHGIQIRGESPYSVSGTRMHNLRLVNINEQFIKGSGGHNDTVGATDGVIENCLFEFTSGWAYQYYTGGIDIHRGVNWIVRDNLFRNIRNPSALANIAEHAVHFWKRSSRPQHIIVERNWIINCDRGIGFGLVNEDGGFQGGGSVIRNNMIYNDGAGSHTDVGIGLEHASGVQVDHNTVYIPAYWAPMEYRFGTSSNLVFRNNLVDKPIQLRSGAPVARLTNNVTTVESDWFKDLSQGDLHLTPAADGAINQGIQLNEVNDDIDAGTRPALGAPDVGADEYHPGWSQLETVAPQTFADGKTPTHEIHVAVGGSNSSGDGSIGNPYATLAHAASQATPGCAIIVASGTYAGGQFINDLAGTAAAPIWIRGASETDRPILSGNNEGLHLTRPRYLVVENLEVTGSNNNGINCDDGGAYGDPTAAQFLLLRNVYVHDVGSGGNQDLIKLSGIDDYELRDCWLANGSAGGSGIDHVGCHRGLIVGCTFTNMGSNAIQCKGGTAELSIRGNRFIDAGQRGVNIGGSTGFTFFRPPLSTSETNAEARAIQVIANIFVGATAPVAFVGAEDCLVAHNTIIDPDNWFFRILQETQTSPPYTFAPCGESAFVKNLVFFERARMSGTDVNVGSSTAPATFFFAHNLWYARDNVPQSQPDLPGPELHGLRGQDPDFTNPAAGDYTITLGSPAARAGLPGHLSDGDFTAEPYLNPPSIGAFEITGDLDLDNLPDVWELRFFANTNVTSGASHEDQDGDLFRDAWEFEAGTDPSNAASLLQLTLLEVVEPGMLRVEWDSVPGRNYSVYGWDGNLPATNWTVLAANRPATPNKNSELIPIVGTQAAFRIGLAP